MNVLKQIKFGTGAATPIAQTVVTAATGESVLSVVGTNTGIGDNADPTYTIALAVDGKTIAKGTNGLETSLALKVEAASGEGSSAKKARIALVDSNGGEGYAELSSVNIEDIVGNGIVKSAAYDPTTGKLTITWAGSGSGKTTEIDLGALLDIDDIIIKSDSIDYLSFTPIDPGTETGGQAQIGVKLADVTYTATDKTGDTPVAANLTVSTTNGKMLAADDAIPAIKSYVDDVVENASTELAVKAQGDAYVAASIDANDNKKVIVATNKQNLTATAGTPGEYAADGSQTTAPTEGTLSGTTNSLADGADIAAKVKTYVDGAIAIEAARSDAKNKADIAALDVTDTAVAGEYVSSVSETDGKVSISRAKVSDAVLTGYAKGEKPASTAIAATDDVKGAIAKLEHQVDDAKAATTTAIEALDFTDTPVDSQYVTKVDETDGKITVARADVSAAKLNHYTKGRTELPLAATDTINEAFSKIEVSIEKNEQTTATALNDINTKIDGMDKAASAVAGQVVTTVSEADGIVNETKANVKDLQLGGYVKDTSATRPIGGADTINTALSKLENAIDAAKAAATTKVEKDANASHLTLTNSTAADGSVTYTIGESDIASKTALDAEIAARKAVDGQNGQTYTANSNTDYISGATSLNDADVKLDAALKGVSDKVDGIQYQVTGTTLEFFGLTAHA